MQTKPKPKTSASFKHCELRKKRIAWLIENRSVWQNKNLSHEDKDQLRIMMRDAGIGGNPASLYWPIFDLLCDAKIILEKNNV
jgi:hypothetical protein